LIPTLEKTTQVLKEAGLLPFFTPQALEGLLAFTGRMLEINETLNLTRWTGEEAVLNQHFLDSAQVLPHLRELGLPKGEDRWMDLGTGCGFPGAILLAAYPRVEMTFLDSVAKKTKALAECLEAAEWKGRTLAGRAEEVGRDPSTRENWDLVTTRAVADLPVVLEYAVPLLKTGGYLVNWMTGEQWASVDKAQEALRTLKASIKKKADYSLPGLDQKRCLVFVEKLGKTPETYPRPVGKASKNPL
jgi:16S rRNA (guanine527-N7)-methyltransferase